jgi:hypothetical protein
MVKGLLLRIQANAGRAFVRLEPRAKMPGLLKSALLYFLFQQSYVIICVIVANYPMPLPRQYF